METADKLMTRAGFSLRVAMLRRQLRGGVNNEAQVARQFDRLGRALRVARVYAFQNFADTVTGEICARQRFEWTDGTVEATIDDPLYQRISYQEAGVHPWIEPMQQGQMVTMTRETAGPALELFEAQQIRSMMLAPVHRDDRWWGFVGVDDCRVVRQWSPAELRALRLIAGAFERVVRFD